MTDLILGADVGGTSIRVLVADADGRRLAYATAGGGNPLSHGAERAAAHFRAAVTEALAGLDARAVRAAVVGAAGADLSDGQPAAGTFGGILASSGVAARVELVGDAEIAFASATTNPDGTVLLAGTGATAARIRDRALDAISDGLGWLLGDHGSGYWLGREAVRAALAALDGAGRPTILADSVSRHLLATGYDAPPSRRRADIVATVLAGPPIALASLAPLVARAELAGDEVASLICDRAAGHLIESVGDIRDPGDTRPLVLSGGVVAPPTAPVGARVRTLAAARFAGEVMTATDPVAGAAWLAAGRAFQDLAEAQLDAVHRRLSTGS